MKYKLYSHFKKLSNRNSHLKGKLYAQKLTDFLYKFGLAFMIKAILDPLYFAFPLVALVQEHLAKQPFKFLLQNEHRFGM